MKKKITIKDELTDFLLYTSPNGDVKVETFLHNETIWLSQKRMGELFGVGIPAISKHLKNIFDSGELNEQVVVSILEIPTKHGAISEKIQKNRTKFYNLDAILSVGYRVSSIQATHFRIWATKTLKEYIVKGFAMDDNRLKNGHYFGKDYFKELLERVRSIRTSERKIYLQITDIFAECSIDYDKNGQITKDFFATIQNKFHFAITGQTAAEIIYKKVDAKQQKMGLTSFKNSPDGRVLKSDVIIAKNYLEENEIKQLERTVSSYFDYIERIIETKTLFTMETLSNSINEFLTFNKYDIMKGIGKISKKQADNKATEEYNEFNKTQKINSDFEKQIKQLEKGDN